MEICVCINKKSIGNINFIFHVGIIHHADAGPLCDLMCYICIVHVLRVYLPIMSIAMNLFANRSKLAYLVVYH